MLIPLKFTPIYKERIWGGRELEKIGKVLPKSGLIGESWEISDVKGDESIVTGGMFEGNSLSELIEVYMEELLGDKVFQKFSTEFPLLIKFIDARDKLSIQVHPDDELAASRHHSYGKTEMWYVLSCDEGAQLYCGFNRKVTKEEYQTYVDNGTLEQILNKIDVKTGDAFFIPAGEIHAIGKGIVIAEIQQTSDITYRVFDWNRVDENGEGRELHTQLALDAINFESEYDSNNTITPTFKNNEAVKMQSCEYFATNVIATDSSIERDLASIDSFVIYIALDGDMVIKYNGGELNISQGDTILVPAITNEVSIIGQGRLIEVYIP
ncbi:MAG: type I phosphomannose isomerase catalytic subunit [Rikenellaceae bacterium]